MLDLEFLKLLCTGRIFEAISEFLLVLLVLLLAKGFTVTRGRLRLPSAVKLTVFLCLYFLIYTFLFFFQAYVRTKVTKLKCIKKIFFYL